MINNNNLMVIVLFEDYSEILLPGKILEALNCR